MTDFTKIVAKKLLNQDKCICSIIGSSVDAQRRVSCVLAVIENLEDHGLFVYWLAESASHEAKDLSLTATLPIDKSFQYSIVSSQPIGVTGGVIQLRVESRGVTHLFELPYGDVLKNVLAELKRTVQLSSQNTSFGLPSTFDWMEKYLSDASRTGFSKHNNMATPPFIPRLVGAVAPPSSVGGAYNALNPFAGDQMKPVKTGFGIGGLNLDASALANEWPYNQIIQLQAGGKCPVVKDTTLHHSSSDQNLKAAKHLTSDLTQKHYLAEPMAASGSKSMRRSYERNLNNVAAGGGGGGGGGSMKPGAGGGSSSGGLNASNLGAREHRAQVLMQQRELEYTKLVDFRVFCGTYNVNGQSVGPNSLSPWLTALAPNGETPDIYAVGFQELDLSTNAYIFSESAKEEEWYNRVKDGLHPNAKYKRVKLVRLVGMMLVVFVKESLHPHIVDLQEGTVGTGLLGMVGNKGGVAVRFRLYDTTLCFVNSHLAAHTEEFERRNQDFRDITSRMSFRSTALGSDSMLTISDHDCVFWLGDLNYRIGDMDAEEIKKRLNNKDLDYLMNCDQLMRQIGLKKVFLDYREGKISFMPTYKYDPGTDNFDTSEKGRAPAWCDRILSRGENIKQLVYHSHPQLKLSDHKPVSAVYNVGIKQVDPVLERRVREDVMKALDQRENEFLPQVSLNVTEVIFKSVKFIELQRQCIEVTNTGQVMVKFELINKPGDSHYCKPWLSFDPCKGDIRPGDKVVLNVEVYVKKEAAPKLNDGSDRIEDIVVLHLRGGKDFFISVSGSFLPSCFGASIEFLVGMFGPVRDIATTSDLIQIEAGGGVPLPPRAGSDGSRPLDVPKELWRLTDFLYRRGLNEDQLFQQPGHHSEITQIRDCLDTGLPATLPGTVHSVAESFVTFLEALAQPIIPFDQYQRCLAVFNDFEACKQVLSQIPQCHRNVFKYVCAFLRTLLQHSASNGLDIKFLATLFGGVLLRPPPAGSREQGNKMEESRKCAGFLFNFLCYPYDE